MRIERKRNVTNETVECVIVTPPWPEGPERAVSGVLRGKALSSYKYNGASFRAGGAHLFTRTHHPKVTRLNSSVLSLTTNS